MDKFNIYYNFKPDLAKNMSIDEFISCPLKTIKIATKVGWHSAFGNGEATTIANGSYAVLHVSERRAKKIVSVLIASGWCERINIEKVETN